jgi:hypothetical protein
MTGVHQATDSKLGGYFAEGLDDAGLTVAAPIVSTEADDHSGILKVTVALQNVADLEVALPGQCGRDARRGRARRDGAVLLPAAGLIWPASPADAARRPR